MCYCFPVDGRCDGFSGDANHVKLIPEQKITGGKETTVDVNLATHKLREALGLVSNRKRDSDMRDSSGIRYYYDPSYL